MPASLPPIDCAIDIDASPAAVFAAYTDLPRWSVWDPDTREARLFEALAVGSKGRLRPRKGLAVRLRIVELVADRLMVVECPVLGSTMRFEHHLEGLDGRRTRARHRVHFSGWLAPLLDRSVGHTLRRGLPMTLAGLKRHVESDQRAACAPAGVQG